MTNVTTSEVEKLHEAWAVRGASLPEADHSGRMFRTLSRQLAAAIQQDKDRAGGADGMLHDALMPVAEQWYSLCERAPYATRITITGELAEAIVKAVCDNRPVQPAEVTDAMVERAARSVAKTECWDGWDEDESHTPNGNTPEEQREWCRDVARAALTAALNQESP